MNMLKKVRNLYLMAHKLDIDLKIYRPLIWSPDICEHLRSEIEKEVIDILTRANIEYRDYLEGLRTTKIESFMSMMVGFMLDSGMYESEASSILNLSRQKIQALHNRKESDTNYAKEVVDFTHAFTGIDKQVLLERFNEMYEIYQQNKG